MLKKVYSLLVLLFCLFIVSSCDETSFDSLNDLYSKEDVIELLNNYYTSSEIDDFFKVNNNYLNKNFYSKEEVDSLIEEFKSHDNLNVIDVTELPQPDWKGTPVPTSGYVEKVYFNTNLSNGEINTILESLTYNNEFCYVPFYLDSVDNRLFIDKDNYEIHFGTDESNIVVYCDPDWEQTYLDIATEINTNGLNVDQNDKLSSLISITPFEYTGPELYTLYKCNGKLYYFDGSGWFEYSSIINYVNSDDLPYDQDGVRKIHLPNGRYLLIINENNGSLKIYFGKTPFNYGKFAVNESLAFSEYYFGAYDEEAFIQFDSSREYQYLIEVDDYKVTFGVYRES